jgi:predicted esterase
MKKTTLLLTLFLCIWVKFATYSQAPFGTPGNQVAVKKGTSALNFGYYEYLPLNFSASSGQKYPVILYYHGIDGKGNGTTDLPKLFNNGFPELIQQGNDYEAIVISPQNSGNGFIGDFTASEFLTIYNYLIANYPIDLNRFYVTGLSAGGGSTWNALNTHYGKIAAALPICGYADLSNMAQNLKQTAIWAHHNFDDNVVNKSKTINNVNKISNTDVSCMSVYPYANGTSSAALADYTMNFNNQTSQWTSAQGTLIPKQKLAFTMYKTGSGQSSLHDSWTRTYTNPMVIAWLLSQKLNPTLSNPDFTLNFEFAIYPNPSNRVINIKSNFDGDLFIANQLGQIVETFKVDSNTVNTINIESLSKGIYFIKSADSNKIGSQKLIVN